MKKHIVCPKTELPPGERRIVDVDGKSIGVFNVDGDYFALRNVCPHHRAPLCLGPITGTITTDDAGEPQLVDEGRVIRCPWHGWEFDITTGRSIFNPHKLGVRTYDVAVETAAGQCDGSSCGTDAKSVERFEVEVSENEDVVLYV